MKEDIFIDPNETEKAINNERRSKMKKEKSPDTSNKFINGTYSQK